MSLAYLRHIAARWWGVRSQPSSPVVFADLSALAQLTDADADEQAEELQELLGLLNPRSRSFGTDVAELVDRCTTQGILTVTAPILSIRIEPTTVGESRDGGFLVLLTITDGITLASSQLLPDTFRNADDIARHVLASVAETANRLHRRLLNASARLTRLGS
jgi:hypothetical protein